MLFAILMRIFGPYRVDWLLLAVLHSVLAVFRACSFPERPFPTWPKKGSSAFVASRKEVVVVDKIVIVQRDIM